MGTRVAVPSGDSGQLLTGAIQAVKTCEDPSLANRFSVRLDSGRVVELLDSDLVGPGFKPVASVKLMPGQLVFVTHLQREMAGKVVRHDFESQDVIINLNDGGETLLKKIDEVRLLESRKSARLINSDTDFSKLADLNISQSSVNTSHTGQQNMEEDTKHYYNARKAISKAIEVPQRTDYVQISGSRKRRTSETLIDDEETMTECSAAMLLMKLSCSPHQMAGSSFPVAPGSSLPGFYPNLPSPVDSSGASSFRSATPSPPLSSSTGTSTADEGIVKDLFQEHHRARSNSQQKPKVVYQCTYPGCRIAAMKSVRSIESHVRKEHLNRSEDHPDDGEEEFYYTEVEIPTTQPRTRAYTEPASQMANLSLADHLDMARPAHEDPGFGVSGSGFGVSGSPTTQLAASGFRHKMRSLSGNGNKSSLLINQYTQGPASLTTPITIAPSVGSPGKYILISPPGNTESISSSAPSSGTSMLKSPGHRRVREGKKCRKVYGLEQRDLWCTQCKWKKACARFGKPNLAPNSNSETSTSLLIPASQQPQGAAVRAIKF